MNEMHILRKGYMKYTDSEQPRQVLTSEQFGNFIYQVGVYPAYSFSSDQFTYMLYKCKISFTECQKLPFHYTDTGGSFKLTFDENTKELKIFYETYNTDDVLIYSYSTVSKCYVERCSIPDK